MPDERSASEVEILPGPSAAPVADPERISLLEQLTTAGDWPRAWLTIPQFDELLFARGFWGSESMGVASSRWAWLTRTFLGVHLIDPVDRKPTFIWCRLLDTFKHHSLVTAEDQRLLADEIRRVLDRWAEEHEAQ